MDKIEKPEVRFEYNGKVRIGIVEKETTDYIVLKHTNPDMYDGKVYSTYRWDRMTPRTFDYA